jgi:hypothetical protein
MADTLHRDVRTFMITSRWILLIMRHFSVTICKGKKNILCRKPFPESHNIHEIMWEKISKYGQATDEKLMWAMRFACWIPKATNTQSEYVALFALSRQQCLHEGASVLRLYTSCLSCFDWSVLLVNLKIVHRYSLFVCQYATQFCYDVRR